MNADTRLDLSIVIITLNEEKKIARCLKSIPAGCEVIVLDSGSVDATTHIASQTQAAIHNRRFDDYSSQKNAAVELANRSWVLVLDADEVIDARLSSYLAKTFQETSAHLIPSTQIFRLQRRLVFMNRILKYGRARDYPIRLFKKGSGSFVGKIHEIYTPRQAAEVVKITNGHLLHYSYDDLTDYFAKFNFYTTRMAAESSASSSRLDFIQVLRPWFEFFMRYFIRLGFLDGYEGYCYAYISSVYKFVKYAKIRELQKKADQ